MSEDVFWSVWTAACILVGYLLANARSLSYWLVSLVRRPFRRSSKPMQGRSGPIGADVTTLQFNQDDLQEWEQKRWQA